MAEVVRIVRVPLHRQVVAEPLRLLVGIGVASHPRQKAGVVDDGALGPVEAHVLAQAGGDETGANDVLHRLAEAQVCAKGERGSRRAPSPHGCWHSCVSEGQTRASSTRFIGVSAARRK
jgi:hypothetical protein